MNALRSRVSYADLEKWPDDGRRYELYDGEVYVVPAPIPLHQMVSARVYLALEERYARARRDRLVCAARYRALRVRRRSARLAAVHARPRASGEPEAGDAAAARSGDRDSVADDRCQRSRPEDAAARHGVREFWLVDPEAVAIEVYRLTGDNFVLASRAGASATVASPLLTGFTLTPRDLVSFE